MFKQLLSKIGTGWCSFAHEYVMWPIHGHYECRTCGRRYPVPAETAVPPGRAKAVSSGAPRLSPRPSGAAA